MQIRAAAVTEKGIRQRYQTRTDVDARKWSPRKILKRTLLFAEGCTHAATQKGFPSDLAPTEKVLSKRTDELGFPRNGFRAILDSVAFR